MLDGPRLRTTGNEASNYDCRAYGGQGHWPPWMKNAGCAPNIGGGDVVTLRVRLMAFYHEMGDSLWTSQLTRGEVCGDARVVPRR